MIAVDGDTRPTRAATTPSATPMANVPGTQRADALEQACPVFREEQ